MIRQGDVFVVDFGNRYNSEFGKNRPALIIQSNVLNEIINEMEYKSVAVIPLTTNLIDNAFFRIRLNTRDYLNKTSDVVCNWICTIDYERIQTRKLLTRLTSNELQLVKDRVRFLID
jgi:mRNA interferase MazF